MPDTAAPKRRPTKRSSATPSVSPRPAAGTGDGGEQPHDPRQEAADRDTVVKALTRMYGCGEIDARRRIAGCDAELVALMAKQERIGRRDRIPALLAGASPTAR